MSQYRRRIFVINKRFQYKYSFFVCSWLFALSIVYPWLIYELFNWFVRTMAIDPNGPQLVALQEVRTQLLWLLAALQGVFMGVTFLISIFVSHRIAGPLYKLTMFMNQARNGKFEHLKFRQGDHFPELAEDFNRMIESIRDAADATAAHIRKAQEQSSDPSVQAELGHALDTLKHLGR